MKFFFFKLIFFNFSFTKMAKTIYNEMCLIQITMANVIMIVLTYVILMVISNRLVNRKKKKIFLDFFRNTFLSILRKFVH